MPLNKAQYFSPAVLENLEQQELVCLDDLQEVIGNPDWEVAIFDLINRIRETGKTLLVIGADQGAHTDNGNGAKYQHHDTAHHDGWDGR